MTIVIIGLGNTGFSCAKYLADKAINFMVMDSRENPPHLAEFKKLYPNIKFLLGKFDQEIIQQSTEVILSPGISPELFPAEKTIGDIELFVREAKAPIIGITGTNAKGTVTTLLGEMIKEAGLTVELGGNIGTAALDLLSKKIPDFYVLELSSFQLEIVHHLPLKSAALLNLSPDHLDRHKTMKNYQQAKQHIYDHTETAIFNRDDIYTFPIASIERNPHRKINYLDFGLDKPDHNQFGLDQDYLAYGENLLLPVSDLKIQGRHNYANALAALALGHSIGLPIQKMLAALKKFPGLPHRCEWVATQNNIHWINDSKGTNIGATIAALEGIGQSLNGKIILIAGGIGKDADFSLLQAALQNYTRTLILIGQDAKLISDAVSPFINNINIQFCSTLQEVILEAKSFALPGDVVLLSPACASFDMFENFEDRGNQFKHLVKDLIQA